jgi:DUF2911 family protein
LHTIDQIKEYEDPVKFDGMTKGKTWRLGKDFWTVLDTNVPLKIAGKEVAAGTYYLGLFRSADGSAWSLAFYRTFEGPRSPLGRI